MSRRHPEERNLTMVQQALVALGESPDTPVIGSVDGTDRPLWTTAEERRDVEEFADAVFAELTGQV
jgi:hypothetical protein